MVFKSYSRRDSNDFKESLCGAADFCECSRFGVVASQIAQISAIWTGPNAHTRAANWNAGRQARQDFKFFRAHGAIESVGREGVGDQREKCSLRRYFFHRRGRIATTVAQDINRGEW